MKKIAVVDLDDTLLLARKRTHYFRTIARFFYRLAFKSQKWNTALLLKLLQFDEIVVLTARDNEEYRELTVKQLSHTGLPIRTLDMPNLRFVMLEWKKHKVELLKKNAEVTWFEDQL